MNTLLNPLKELDNIGHMMSEMIMGPDKEITPTMAINMYERDNTVFVDAELPGFEIKDIKVSALKDRLEIFASRDKAISSKLANTLHEEISTTKLSRKISLPRNIDVDKVEATLRNGVLSVSMPIVQPTKPKSVNVMPSTQSQDERTKDVAQKNISAVEDEITENSASGKIGNLGTVEHLMEREEKENGYGEDNYDLY